MEVALSASARLRELPRFTADEIVYAVETLMTGGDVQWIKADELDAALAGDHEER